MRSMRSVSGVVPVAVTTERVIMSATRGGLGEGGDGDPRGVCVDTLRTVATSWSVVFIVSFLLRRFTHGSPDTLEDGLLS
jgi:hypothetical protein